MYDACSAVLSLQRLCEMTLPYLTLPYLTLPYLTLPYLTLPYLTLPYLTLPYLTLPYLTFYTGGAGKSWGETVEELARDIAHRLPAQFDIERALIQFPVR
jgi:hypothetical protein